MAVDLASDGEAALAAAHVYDYDVIVLDRDLPKLHGDRVCRTLVEEEGGARVLMLTASGGIEDRVTGLSLGADDYLPQAVCLCRSWWRGSAPWPGAPTPPCLRCWSTMACDWTQRGGRPAGTSGRWT